VIGTRPRVFVLALAIAALVATGIGMAEHATPDAEHPETGAAPDRALASVDLAAPHKYAEFRTEAEYINRTTAYPGQPVRVVETVENYGNEAGSYTGLFLVGLELRQTDDVWVEPEARANATFVTSFDEPGTYNVYVRTNWIGRVTVRERPEPTVNATRTDNGTATVAVRNATAGTRLSTPLPPMNATDHLDAESLTVRLDAPARRLNLTVTETPSPANESLPPLRPGLDPAGFVNVSHDGRSDAVADVSLSFAVGGGTDAAPRRLADPNLSVVRYDTDTGEWRRFETAPSVTTAAFGRNGTAPVQLNTTGIDWPNTSALLSNGPGASHLLAAEMRTGTGNGTTNGTPTTAGNGTRNGTAAATRHDVSLSTPGTVAVVRQRPAIAVASTTVAPATLTTDRRAVATATVRNDGRADGQATVPLVVDGERVAARSVALAPGAATTVRFTFGFDEAGLHRLAVGNATARTVTVDPAPTATPAPRSMPVEAARDIATPPAVADESRAGRSGFTTLALIGTVLAGVVGVVRWRD
jgi:hypothetical protein